MVISEITIDNLKKYANVTHTQDDDLFGIILDSSKAFLCSYTGLEESELDWHKDLVICMFILSNEMYDNRMITVDSDKISFVMQQLLASHSVNLL